MDNEGIYNAGASNGGKSFGTSTAATTIYGGDYHRNDPSGTLPTWIVPAIAGGAALILVFVLTLILLRKK